MVKAVVYFGEGVKGVTGGTGADSRSSGSGSSRGDIGFGVIGRGVDIVDRVAVHGVRYSARVCL
jgi:hypothetical protein